VPGPAAVPPVLPPAGGGPASRAESPSKAEQLYHHVITKVPAFGAEQRNRQVTRASHHPFRVVIFWITSLKL